MEKITETKEKNAKFATGEHKKIAVTGGIGSGKSAVCEILRDMGYPVFSCDEIYKTMQTDPRYLAALEEAFPGAVKGDVLDKKFLSARVFSDPAALKRLNGLAHPEIMRRLYAETEKYPLSFAEVPLLFESGREKDFDAVIVVYRPENERVAAVCRRDGFTPEQVLERIKNQVDYEKIRKEGHTVIYNDGDYVSLREKVALAVEKILN